MVISEFQGTMKAKIPQQVVAGMNYRIVLEATEAGYHKAMLPTVFSVSVYRNLQGQYTLNSYEEGFSG